MNYCNRIQVSLHGGRQLLLESFVARRCRAWLSRFVLALLIFLGVVSTGPSRAEQPRPDGESFGMTAEKELSLNVQWDNHNANVTIKFRFCGQGRTHDGAVENLKDLARTQFGVIRSNLLRNATGSRYTSLNSSQCPYPTGVYFGGGEFADLVAACSTQVSACGPNYIKCLTSRGRPCWRFDPLPKTRVP